MSDDTWAPMKYPGSFQGAPAFPSENPREEAWQRLLRFATPELSTSLLARFGDQAEPLRRYVQARLRQAFEFRQAARGRSVMTSPLMLYYSFLNLARAIVALREGLEGKRGHGLRFERVLDGTGLMDCAAKVQVGTFTDFLTATGRATAPHATISLREALTSIPELVLAQSSAVGHSRVAEIHVVGYMEGPLRIELVFGIAGVSEQYFRDNWQAMFPTLKDLAILGEAGARLKVTANIARSYTAISDFCHRNLLNDLMLRDDARWYLLREDRVPAWDRASYYLAAMFILSSIVRYEPDGLADLVATGSDAAWMLDRFVDKADRFFPQLMYSVATSRPMYF